MAGGRRAGVSSCDHTVTFYEDDDDLVATVGNHLLEGLRRGGAALAVATPPHRQAIVAHLTHHGVDASAASNRSHLVLLDARQTLDRLLAGGRPDPRLFGDVVGGVVRRAVETGAPVHVFGEMVDLLWEDGDVSGAIALEAMWNSLGDELPFSLLCAYRSQLVDTREAVEEISAIHSALVGPVPDTTRPDAGPAADSSCRLFHAGLRAPFESRQFVRSLLRGLDEDLVADAAVVVTELSTNAVVHARSDFSVAVDVMADALRISVSDASGTEPIGRSPGAAGASGRGLGMVAALSRCWGSDRWDGGKRVWAELSRRPSRSG